MVLRSQEWMVMKNSCPFETFLCKQQVFRFLTSKQKAVTRLIDFCTGELPREYFSSESKSF
jgi:hypothetical protein